MTRQAQNYKDNHPELERSGSSEVAELKLIRLSEIAAAFQFMAKTFSENFGQITQQDSSDSSDEQAKTIDLSETAAYVPEEMAIEGPADGVDLSETVSYDAKPVERAVVELDSIPKNSVVTTDGLSEKEDKLLRTRQAREDLEQVDV